MNPTFAKIYGKLMSSLYHSKQCIVKSSVFESSYAYFSYGRYLTRNWFPRFSHYQTYTNAYTPKYIQYNAYIIYGLVSAFFLYEFNRISRQKRRVQARRIALANQ